MISFLDKVKALEDNGELAVLQSDYIVIKNLLKSKIDGVDDLDNEFLSIDQSIRYLKSINGIKYSKTEFKHITQLNKIKPCFHYECYIDSASKSTSTPEKIKAYFSFDSLYDYIDQENSYIQIPEGMDDNIIIYQLLESETNTYSDGDSNLFLYTLEPSFHFNQKNSILNSFLQEDIKFSKVDLDSYLKNTNQLHKDIEEIRASTDFNKKSIHYSKPSLSDFLNNNHLSETIVRSSVENNEYYDTQEYEERITELKQSLINIEEKIKQKKEEESKTEVLSNPNHTLQPKSGISVEKQQAKETARILAKLLWNKDVNKNIKISAMCDVVYSELYESAYRDQLPDQTKSIKAWIEIEAPKYAREAGRPSEN